MIDGWMENKVYGNNTSTADKSPTKGRESLLAYYKKSISHFMPTKMFRWDMELKWGNSKMS